MRSPLSSRISWVACCIVTTAGIGVLDYATGVELGFFIFYLLPIAGAAWFAGRWAGLTLGVASAMAWVIAETQAGRSYSATYIPYWNMAIRLTAFCGAALLLARLDSALQREKLLSRTDRMTQLPNRTSFYEMTEREIARSKRTRTPLTVAYIDLDGFKEVNDTLGHIEGDDVLRETAAALRQFLRATDVAARLGGDEFIVLFPEAGPEGAQALGQQLMRSLIDAMASRRTRITFSIGLATFLEPMDTAESIIKQADDLMYIAKRKGKNRIEHRTIPGGVAP